MSPVAWRAGSAEPRRGQCVRLLTPWSGSLCHHWLALDGRARGRLALRRNELPVAGLNLDLTSVVDQLTTDDRLLDPTLQCLALQRRPALLVEQVLGLDRPGSVEVDHYQVPIRADANGALASVDAKHLSSAARRKPHEGAEIPAPRDDSVADQDRDHRLDAGHTPRGIPYAAALLLRARVWRMIGS